MRRVENPQINKEAPGSLSRSGGAPALVSRVLGSPLPLRWKTPFLSGSLEPWLCRFLLLLMMVWLAAVVLFPLVQIFIRSVSTDSGQFIGLANFARYFRSPSLSRSLYNTLFVSLLTTGLSVSLGFIYAYGITRTALPWKGLFRSVAMIPLYAPTLMNGIALVYLFGNKGIITKGLFGLLHDVFGVAVGIPFHLYGPVGIVLAETVYAFPQAVLILSVALLLADARIYEAAQSMGASKLRILFTVTLPGIKYGLMSAVFVCFTLCFTDFGAPKVVGGNYPVLATDMYKQVIGQQNFAMGAVVSIILLAPTAIAFFLDRLIQRRQTASVTSRAVPLSIRPNAVVDRFFLVYCIGVSLAILAVVLTVVLASLIRVWPYNLSLGLRHYQFRVTGGGGYGAYWNSIRMSAYTALFGTAVTFACAYLIEKTRGMTLTRQTAYFMSIIPLALPGLVIGLAYIFFFNLPELTLPAFSIRIPNPFHFLYGTMAILVISNIVHFYSVSFLTATTALKQLDREFEAVSASLSVPFYRTFWRITVPVCLPAILEIGMYYFVNAMATVSAVIFLYSPELKLASVAVVNMDDAGDTAPAAAMSVLIVATNIGVRAAYDLIAKRVLRNSQTWRKH